MKERSKDGDASLSLSLSVSLPKYPPLLDGTAFKDYLRLMDFFISFYSTLV
jgi:hypothetical protein